MQVRQLEDKLTRVEGRVEGLHQGANQTILFGVILLATTITGVLAALMLQGGVLPDGDVSISRLLSVSGAVVLFGLGTAAIVWLLLCSPALLVDASAGRQDHVVRTCSARATTCR